MYFSARVRISWVRAADDRSYLPWVFQYRSARFGAVARAHPRPDLGIECDFVSLWRRKSELVLIERGHILPSFKSGTLVIELVLTKLCEMVKLKGPVP